MKISKTTVDKLTPPDKGYSLHWDGELRGFGVRVTAAGAKSYIAQAKVDGKARRETIGRHGTITASQARSLAKAALGKMAAGNDPAAVKRERKAKAVTLEDVAKDYKANRRTSKGLPLKASTKADIDKHLADTFADWKARPITEISREMVSRRYALRCKRSVAQANQAFRILRALINYAAARHRDAEDRPIIKDNPVGVLRDASMLRAVKARKTFVPLDQIGAWWSALTKMRTSGELTKASQAAADLIALLAVTGLRIGEARALRWDDVDLEGRAMRLTDTKNRTDLTAPLSGTAAAILESRPNRSGYVFPARSGSGHLSDCRGQLQALSEQTGIEVTAHDLRRTFRAVAAACNVELWRTKALMNHKQNSDITLAAYTDLSDVRNLKPEADRIGEHFEEQRKIHEGGNVVSMKDRRA